MCQCFWNVFELGVYSGSAYLGCMLTVQPGLEKGRLRGALTAVCSIRGRKAQGDAGLCSLVHTAVAQLY